MARSIERFLANPPRRIGAAAVAKRKKNHLRRMPPGWKKALGKKQKWKCFYCARPMQRHAGPMEATFDHVLPLSRGGRSSKDNVVLACIQCNVAKGSSDVAEFRAAQGIEARSATTEGRGPKDESPVAKRCAHKRAVSRLNRSEP